MKIPFKYCKIFDFTKKSRSFDAQTVEIVERIWFTAKKNLNEKNKQ